MNKLAARTLAGAPRVTFAIGFGAVLTACAAAKSPQSAPAAGAVSAQADAQQGAYPSMPAEAAPAPPPPPPASQPAPEARPDTPPSTPSPPSGGATAGTSRSMAIQSAANDVDSSQRELDVAAGDCRNACRALGSMDRAAGRLCELAQGSPEGRRCNDAKQRVYSARDRVKTTCGSCPDGPTVERAAPIPSLR
jgi:hypothetical protein